jgi:hypothetical protein
MKRAALTVYPPTASAEPADLTDRLLAREAGNLPAPATKRRGPPRASRAGRKTAPAEPAAASLAPASDASSLEVALAAADSATEALRQAGRDAPARYDVALRYRLDALAHHLQQVKEFVTSLTVR